jgi:hypothetical protein
MKLVVKPLKVGVQPTGVKKSEPTKKPPELCQCPFCGAHAEMNGANQTWYVLCLGCECQTKTMSSRVAARNKWNLRTNFIDKKGRNNFIFN